MPNVTKSKQADTYTQKEVGSLLPPQTSIIINFSILRYESVNNDAKIYHLQRKAKGIAGKSQTDTFVFSQVFVFAKQMF